MCFFINRDYRRVSKSIFHADKFDGEFYAVKEGDYDASWAYYAFNGKSMNKVSENYDECQPFSKELDLGLVKDAYYTREDCTGEKVVPCYYVNRIFMKVSPFYKDGSCFNEIYDVARVLDFDNSTYYVNDEFTQVSPKFSIAFGLDDEGVIVGSLDNERFAFYQYEDGEFVKKSKDFAMAHAFFKNKVTTVKDIVSGKFYVVDRDYNKVSEDFEHLTGFSGNPAVARYRKNQKLKGLTAVSLSKVSDTCLYSDIYKALKGNGYDSCLSTISDDIQNKLYNANNKKEALNDIKVAIKDFLLVKKEEFIEQCSSVEATSDYIDNEIQNIDTALSLVVPSDEPDNN